MDLQLTGKTALVTAATGGIGLAIARALAAEGAARGEGRDLGTTDGVVAGLGAIRSTPARGLLAGAATAEGAEAVAREAPDVDIPVNNLGIYETKPFGDMRPSSSPPPGPPRSSATNGAALRAEGGLVNTIA